LRCFCNSSFVSECIGYPDDWISWTTHQAAMQELHDARKQAEIIQKPCLEDEDCFW
jgi:hypothetical protein